MWDVRPLSPESLGVFRGWRNSDKMSLTQRESEREA